MDTDGGSAIEGLLLSIMDIKEFSKESQFFTLNDTLLYNLET